MQLWFLMLLAGMVFAGVGNFISKIASMRAYEAGRFTVIGTALSVPFLAILLLFYSAVPDVPWWMLAVGFFGGTLGGVNTVVKIKALDYIDTTIYFPLFKLLSPLLAIAFGITVWNERFSFIEWIGIILSLLVPLLLITPSENRRQNNLKLGLIFVLISSGLGAGGAVIMKYMSDYIPDALLMLFVTTCGVSVGGVIGDPLQEGFFNFAYELLEATTSRGAMVTGPRFLYGACCISYLLCLCTRGTFNNCTGSVFTLYFDTNRFIGLVL